MEGWRLQDFLLLVIVFRNVVTLILTWSNGGKAKWYRWILRIHLEDTGYETGESDLAGLAREEHRPCLLTLTGYSARVMAAPVVGLRNPQHSVVKMKTTGTTLFS